METLIKIIGWILSLLKLIHSPVGGREKWEKEYARVLRDFEEKRQAYHTAVAAGDTARMPALQEQWVRASIALEGHCNVGERAGYLGRGK